MNRIVKLVFLLVFPFAVSAQQQSQFSQYMLNYYIINPAVAGTEDFTDVKVGFRNQWTGFVGAPKNYYVSAHAPIGKMHSRVQKGKPKKPHHTIGGIVSGQRLGAFSHTGYYASYGYHTPINRTFMLSMGLSVGLQNYTIDAGRLDYGDQISDPTANSAGTKLNPDLNAGIWLYNKNVFFGISSMQLLHNKLDFAPNTGGSGAMNRHFYITGGAAIPINEELKFVPSVLMKVVFPQAFQLDVNAKLRYKDSFWGGIGLRKTDAVVLIIGGVVSNTLELGYSYDVTTSKLTKFSSGSHEIMVGVRLHAKGRVVCPSQYW